MAISDLRLPNNPLQKLIILALWIRGADKGWCTASHAQLAEDCSISTASIKQHLKILEQTGIIKVKRQFTSKGGLLANKYMVIA